MTINQKQIHEEVTDIYDYIIALRRHFHRHPEPSLKEFETIQRIKEEVEEIGVPYINVGETGILATLIGGKGAGKTILLRADIDALPLPDETGQTLRFRQPRFQPCLRTRRAYRFPVGRAENPEGTSG